eukprot:5059493-Lingulodinium_polyedra.AAC.1
MAQSALQTDRPSVHGAIGDRRRAEDIRCARTRANSHMPSSAATTGGGSSSAARNAQTAARRAATSS